MPTRAVINAVLAGGISTAGTAMRSEERRVGKEGRSRGAPDHLKKKKKQRINNTVIIQRKKKTKKMRRTRNNRPKIRPRHQSPKRVRDKCDATMHREQESTHQRRV